MLVTRSDVDLRIRDPGKPFCTSHDSLIDYIAVSGSMDRNVLEFVDHLHEHFLYPCSINQNGRYNVPSSAKEGYRCESRIA